MEIIIRHKYLNTMTREEFIKKWWYGWYDPLYDIDGNNSLVRADLDELLKQEAINSIDFINKFFGLKIIPEELYQLYKESKNEK